MVLIVEYVLVFFNTISVVFHPVGIYLLTIIYKTGKKEKIATLYLINLSISEFLRNLLSIATSPIVYDAILPHTNATLSLICHELSSYLGLMSAILVEIIYYASMIFLTLNRLFEIQLNIRYHLFWSLRKAKWSLVVTWFIAVITWVAISVIDSLHKIKEIKLLSLYAYIILDMIYVFIAIITYFVIFRTYKAAIAALPRRKAKKTLSKYRQPRFNVLVLLIASFIILVALTDFIFFFFGFITREKPDITFMNLNLICLAVSDLCDVWIYIFMDLNVRRLLWRRFHISFCCCSEIRKASVPFMIYKRDEPIVSNEILACDTSI